MIGQDLRNGRLLDVDESRAGRKENLFLLAEMIPTVGIPVVGEAITSISRRRLVLRSPQTLCNHERTMMVARKLPERRMTPHEDRKPNLPEERSSITWAELFLG